MPTVYDLSSIAIDYICENLPRSTESRIVLDPELTVFMSRTKIFSFAVPPTNIPFLKSDTNTLFNTSTLNTGLGPPCQKWILF